MAGADGAHASPSRRRFPSPPHKRTRWDDAFVPLSARIPSPTSPSYPSNSPSEPAGNPGDHHFSPTPVSINRTRCDGDGGRSPPTHPPSSGYSPSEPTERDRQGCDEQEQRYAEKAIRRHNKNKGNKVKYALVEIVASDWFIEDDSYEFDVHLNLHVRAKNGPKKHGPPELVFAELWKGKALTSWQILDAGKECFPGRRSQGDLSLYYNHWARDTSYCYACDQEILHPEGSLYKKGHYTGRDYHPDYD